MDQQKYIRSSTSNGPSKDIFSVSFGKNLQTFHHPFNVFILEILSVNFATLKIMLLFKLGYIAPHLLQTVFSSINIPVMVYKS